MSTTIAENETSGGSVAVAGKKAQRRRPPIERYGTVIFFLLLFAGVTAVKGTQFLSIDNIALVLAQNAHLAFCAAAVTITLIAGQFDLSVGALAGLAAMLLALFTSNVGIALIPAVLLVLLIGVVAGLVNGLLVTRGRINAFIVTLGTGSAFGGVAIWASGGGAVFEGIPTGLTNAGTSEIAGLALPVLYVVALLVVGWVLTQRAVIGRFWYAIGSNVEAAKLAGVKVERHTVWAFVATALLATIAGIVLLARFGSADPNTGPELLLPAFAAAFLGSSIANDGRFIVVGAIIATFFVAFAQNGMELLGLSPGVKPIFNGLVLVAAVGLSQQLRRRRSA